MSSRKSWETWRRIWKANTKSTRYRTVKVLKWLQSDNMIQRVCVCVNNGEIWNNALSFATSSMGANTHQIQELRWSSISYISHICRVVQSAIPKWTLCQGQKLQDITFNESSTLLNNLETPSQMLRVLPLPPSFSSLSFVFCPFCPSCPFCLSSPSSPSSLAFRAAPELQKSMIQKWRRHWQNQNFSHVNLYRNKWQDSICSLGKPRLLMRLPGCIRFFWCLNRIRLRLMLFGQ